MKNNADANVREYAANSHATRNMINAIEALNRIDNSFCYFISNLLSIEIIAFYS